MDCYSAPTWACILVPCAHLLGPDTSLMDETTTVVVGLSVLQLYVDNMPFGLGIATQMQSTFVTRQEPSWHNWLARETFMKILGL
jgi:hypothetical protein